MKTMIIDIFNTFLCIWLSILLMICCTWRPLLLGLILHQLLLSIDVDDCHNHTCQNGASCVDGVNDYLCTCVLGFTGQSCETSRLSFPESHH